jgi:hypothetical protein
MQCIPDDRDTGNAIAGDPVAGKAIASALVIDNAIDGNWVPGYGGSRRCSSRRVASVQCVTSPWPRRLATVSYALKIDGRFWWQRSCECM